jgi:hypothetical protein
MSPWRASRRGMRIVDLIGRRFGKLTVIERVGTQRQSATSTVALWKCICDCGTERITHTSRLTNGRSRHCGRPQCRSDYRGSRGLKRVPTYHSWQNMISRCTQPSNPAFAHYSGRGIVVCERWRKYENFLADMGERPSGTTLDRWPNNDGNYEPGNCRWATKREQANNRITNISFRYRGRNYTLAELARVTGVSKETLRVRLVRPGGWSVKDAVETPTIPRAMRRAGLSKRA